LEPVEEAPLIRSATSRAWLRLDRERAGSQVEGERDRHVQVTLARTRADEQSLDRAQHLRGVQRRHASCVSNGPSIRVSVPKSLASGYAIIARSGSPPPPPSTIGHR
jgi:hypothetical protein